MEIQNIQKNKPIKEKKKIKMKMLLSLNTKNEMQCVEFAL